MDEFKENLVIFELDRENIANLYFWVTVAEGEEGMVSVEPVSRIFSYMDHRVSPYWVKEDGVEEMIEKALKTIDEYPKDELSRKIKEFEEEYNNEDGKRDGWYDEWDKTEEEMYKEVEQARAGSGYWPWDPNEQKSE
jgi:hypothetical protein